MWIRTLYNPKLDIIFVLYFIWKTSKTMLWKHKSSIIIGRSDEHDFSLFSTMLLSKNLLVLWISDEVKTSNQHISIPFHICNIWIFELILANIALSIYTIWRGKEDALVNTSPHLSMLSISKCVYYIINGNGSGFGQYTFGIAMHSSLN